MRGCAAPHEHRRSPAALGALGALRVGAGLIAVSAAWYAMISLAIALGSTHFYAPSEHVLILAYCAASYLACRLGARAWPAAWRAVAASFAVAGLLDAGVFVVMRLTTGADLRLLAIAFNTLLIVATTHTTIAAGWFLSRYIAARLVAVAAQADAERAAARSELHRLQQHVDPHFLFNSLSILTALVRSDPERAAVFTERLTALYRHLVRHHTAEWATLDDELAFAESYVHVLAARFGRAFAVTIDAGNARDRYVIPGLVHELLTNVVKHNRASDDQPLAVELRVEADHLIARNLLRPKRVGAVAEPAGHGLAMLAERYRLQAGEPLTWRVDGDAFVVTAPLIAGAG